MGVYIVCSGNGYFVRFDSGSPLMDSDASHAAQMEKGQAEKIVKQLGELGFVGELVEISRNLLHYWATLE